jgi:hypothetical protein
LTLNPALLHDARLLAQKSSLSVERFIAELVEAEIASRRIPPTVGEPRLAGSSASEHTTYRLRL